MRFPKGPINGTVAKLWLKTQDVPLRASRRETQDATGMRGGEGGGGAGGCSHRKMSKAETSLETSQSAPETLMLPSVPQCPEDTSHKQP